MKTLRTKEGIIYLLEIGNEQDSNWKTCKIPIGFFKTTIFIHIY